MVQTQISKEIKIDDGIDQIMNDLMIQLEIKLYEPKSVDITNRKMKNKFIKNPVNKQQIFFKFFFMFFIFAGMTYAYLLTMVPT